MPILFSLGDARDLIVVIYGIVGILFFLAALIVTIALFFSVKGLLRMVRELVDDSVKPTMTSIRETAETIRGTTEYVGRTAVTPIARTYGAFAGVKKGVSVLSGLSRRRRGK